MPDSDTPVLDDSHTVRVSLEERMESAYLDYAMSVIVGRALPDARDGLKPVHRRILHAMREAGNDHNKPFKKSARIVGDVLGKYHPHGGEAVYDSLVRMAQDFSMRAPLVDGQGNFGSVDGDNPAAMRYTEVRLSRIAAVLLEDLDKNTVDFVPNYDGAEKEPVVLPAQFPNLLVNGSAGIAVGMATNIPPHNLGEIVDACLHLIKKPEASAEELRRFVPAPDFPTGGLIHGLAGARDAYNTGRGRVVMRAKTHFEDLERGNRRAIVVDEIPYQVNKSVLAARIAELAREKKIEGIADLRDESDRTGIRLVIELRRGENEEVALNRLFKETQLQDSFSINMVALRDGEPKTLGLRELLKIFLDHRREVVVRRAVFDLARARDKAHLLEGYVVALENLDKQDDYLGNVLGLIKASKSPADAEFRLMFIPGNKPSGQHELRLEENVVDAPEIKWWSAETVADILTRVSSQDYAAARPESADPARGLKRKEHDEKKFRDGWPVYGHTSIYGFSQAQARGILEMRLSRLTSMERDKIVADYEKTVAEIAELLSLLSDPEKINALIADELRAVKKAHANPRRSVIDEAGADIDIESLIAEEDMVVTFSHRGYVKRQPASDYRAQRRGGRGRRAATAREDDFIQKVFVAGTHDYLLIFTNRGRVYWKKVYELPVASYTGRGKTLVSLMDSWADRESVQAVLPVRDFEGERFAVMATAGGTVKKTPLSAFSRPRPSGIIALTLENDRLVDAAITGGEHTITLATDAGKALRFHESKLRPMGRSARGVRGIRIPEGREVVNMLVADEEEARRDSILIATENGYGKRTNFAEFPVKGRGGQGMIAVRVGAKNGKVVGAVEAQDTDDLMLITSGGVMVRTAMSSIRRMGRATTGVRLIALDQGAKLAGIARVADDGEDGGNGEGGGGGERMTVRASIVVPTYGEAENIPHLVRAVDAAMRAGEVSYELIVADDPSGDGTAAACAALSDEFPLRLLSRTGPRGLSAAVVDGIAAATGEFVVVMDADLSHPPERIPEMVEALRSGRADFVVGSRYVSGGGTAADWGFFRWLNSKAATWLAAPLAPLADPMSGFFALRRGMVPARDSLSPIGYKIGLEILVKAGFGRGRIAETPIYFRDRERGESKMTLREQVNYLRHLRRLYHHRWPKRMEALQFCAVGGVGLAWDLLFYYGLQFLGLGHLTARALAFWPAVTSNWFLNRVMTFKTRARDFAARQWLKFATVSALGFGVNWGAYAALTSGLDWFDRNRLLALLIGVLAGTAWNFVVSDLFVFRRKR